MGLGATLLYGQILGWTEPQMTYLCELARTVTMTLKGLRVINMFALFPSLGIVIVTFVNLTQS